MKVAACLKQASEKRLKTKVRQKRTEATTKWQNEGSHLSIDECQDLLNCLNLEASRERTTAREKTVKWILLAISILCLF